MGAHVMVVADSAARQREATSAWLDEEIGRGAKIYYKGWFDAAAAGRHWVGGPDGPRRGRDALARGQIELCDFATVIERCGARPRACTACRPTRSPARSTRAGPRSP